MPIPALSSIDFTQQAVDVLPIGWFSAAELQPTGGTYKVMQMLTNGDVQNYTKLLLLQTQGNIVTSYGAGLDLHVRNFYGTTLPRQLNETDVAYRGRFLGRLFNPAGTRRGMIAALERALNRTPVIIEPDGGEQSGGYFDGKTVCGPFAYNVGGSPLIQAPYQVFIQIEQPPVGDPYYMSKADIYRLIDEVKPAGITAWVWIKDPA